MGRGFGFLIAAALLAGTASVAPAHAGEAKAIAARTDWRAVATIADRKRLRSWRTAFVEGLNQARGAGFAAEIAREGPLLDPDAAEPVSDRIPAGSYRCRIIKLGAAQPGLGRFTRYPDFSCRISDEGEVASFTKIDGSQRPVGLIFDNDEYRRIFLGTLMLGDEKRALDYGSDADRDIAGAIERLGPARWRMIFPYPRFESVVDVMELVPAG